jgi:glycosyltransferase involved in cell wall biosynthesis
VKILHVETGRHFLGGPQQVVYLINALRELGHDNTLVCPPDSGLDGVARLAGIRVQNLFCAGDLDLSFAYRLAQFLKDHAPDIVHCHSRRGADVLGGLAASFADIPAVVSRRVDNAELQLMATLRYKPFRKIIAISEAIAKVLREHDVDAERIAVIRSAVDAVFFQKPPDGDAFRREFGIEDGMFTIAAAGQLIRRKGHRFLLQAMAGITRSHPNIRLIIFGDGQLDTELRAQAASLELGGIVRFAGFRDDLDDFIGCFDLLVHPALTEGLGVAALKAAAAGLPVVGFDSGGLSEVIEQGVTGLLVPPESVEGLGQAIVIMIDDTEMRQRMGSAARERMQNDFSIVTMADQHVLLYESILNG